MSSRALDPQERVCMNCRFLRWMVGIGQGVRCRHPANESHGKLFKIPCRNYSCEHFEPEEGPEDPRGRVW